MNKCIIRQWEPLWERSRLQSRHPSALEPMTFFLQEITSEGREWRCWAGRGKRVEAVGGKAKAEVGG